MTNRYSLRSLEVNAPWIRNIYIVTNGQVPTWLDTSNPRVKIVTHKEIFTEQNALPTFSSPAIELNLHHIPGLSDYFIYFNDDVFLGSPVYPYDFMTLQQGQVLFASWEVPTCSDKCRYSFLGNGYCDFACNTAACGYDLGDCAPKPTEPPAPTKEEEQKEHHHRRHHQTGDGNDDYDDDDYDDDDDDYDDDYKDKGDHQSSMNDPWEGDLTLSSLTEEQVAHARQITQDEAKENQLMYCSQACGTLWIGDGVGDDDGQ